MSLYFVIFGNLVGSRIGEMGGFSYMQFYCARLNYDGSHYQQLCQRLFKFFSAKFQKSIEELIMSPVPLHAILWGYVLGGVSRGVLVGIIVGTMSLFFTDLYITNWFVTIYTVLITFLFIFIRRFY